MSAEAWLSEYSFALENGVDAHPELLPLYTEHYAEMAARLKADGVEIEPFNPQTEVYFDYMRRGFLRTYVVRHEMQAVGYCNLYVTRDMHNSAKVATEDAIFITKAHRNGVGRKLVKFILADLATLGVKRVLITPVTDLRVGKIWARMGFREISTVMIYDFGKEA
jgi:predicted acetyltransferase